MDRQCLRPCDRCNPKAGVPYPAYLHRLLFANYEYYDLLLVMDSNNIRNLRRVIGEDTQDKVHLLLDYTERKGASIADPWYTGDFEVTYDDIMEGLEGLLKYLKY